MRTLGLKQVKHVMEGWEPPQTVRLLCIRDGRYYQSGKVLSLGVEWHRLSPDDYVEPA